MDEDQQHLRLLSISHYVVAGLAGLFSLLPILHLVIGLGMASGALETNDEWASVLGILFALVAVVMIVLGLTFAVCLALAGRFLAARRNRTYCLVMAGLACMFVPFGTVLGVLTIIVLMRDSVRELFEGAARA